MNEANHVCTASEYFQFLSGRHPTAKALIKHDTDSKAKIKNFYIMYVISNEQLVFTKTVTLYKLQEKHRINTGLSYKSEKASTTQAHRQLFASLLVKLCLVSKQMATLTKGLFKMVCFWPANLTAMLKKAWSMCLTSIMQSASRNTPFLIGCINFW